MPRIPFLQNARGLSSFLAQDDKRPESSLLDARDADFSPVGDVVKRNGTERLAILPDRGAWRTITTGYLQATGVADPGFASSWSVGGWFIASDYSAGATRLVFELDDEGVANAGIQVFLSATGQLTATLNDGTLSATVVNTTLLTDGTAYAWHCIWDAAADKLYLLWWPGDFADVGGGVGQPAVATVSTASLTVLTPASVEITVGDQAGNASLSGFHAELYWSAANRLGASGDDTLYAWYKSFSHQSISNRADDQALFEHVWHGDDGSSATAMADAVGSATLTRNSGNASWVASAPAPVACFGPEGSWHADTAAIWVMRDDTTSPTSTPAKGISFWSVTAAGVATLMGGAPDSANIPTVAWLEDHGLVCFGDIENRILYDADASGSGDPSVALAGIFPSTAAPTASASGTGVDAKFMDGTASALTANFAAEADNAGILGANTTDTALDANFGNATVAVTSCSLSAKDDATHRISGSATRINVRADVSTPPVVNGAGMRIGLVGTAGAPTTLNWSDKSDYICLVVQSGRAWLEYKVGGGAVVRGEIKGDVSFGSRWEQLDTRTGIWEAINPQYVIDGGDKYQIVWPNGQRSYAPKWKYRRVFFSRGRAFIAQSTRYRFRIEFDNTDWRVYFGTEVQFTIAKPAFSVTNWYPTIGWTGGGVTDGTGWATDRMTWGTGQYIGAYKVWTTYYDNDRGTESEPTDPVTVDAAAQAISVTVIPPPTQLGITHVRVYRSLPDGGIGYLDGAAAITATSYAMSANDDFADKFDPVTNPTVGLPLQRGTRYRPPRAKYVARHGDRLVIGGLDPTARRYNTRNTDDDEPEDQVAWSIARSAEYFPRGAIFSDFVELDGAAVTGMASDGRRLYVFEARRTWRFDGDLANVAESSFNILDHDHGCVAGRAIGVLGTTVVVPTHAGMRIATSGGLADHAAGIDARHVDRQWRGESLGLGTTFESAQASRNVYQSIAWAERQEIWWTVRTSGATENDLVLILDLQTGAWRTYRLFAEALGLATLSNLEDVVFADGPSLFRYRGPRSAVTADGNPAQGASKTTVFKPSSASAGTEITEVSASFATGTALQGVRGYILSGTSAGTWFRVVSATGNVLTIDRSVSVDTTSLILLGAIDFRLHAAINHRPSNEKELKRVVLSGSAETGSTHANLTMRIFRGDTEQTSPAVAAYLKDADATDDVLINIRARARHRRLSVRFDLPYPDSPVTIHDFSADVVARRLARAHGTSGAATPV